MVAQVPSLVTISHKDLIGTADCAPQIKQAFGPDGLGIIAIRDVPGYSLRRQALLPLVAKFAALPEKVRERYEAPDLAYCIGWSHGKEQLSTGKPDMYKGSYYANPVFDYPNCSDELRTKYPDFYGANIWPTQHLPELETAFKNLGQLIVSTGHSLAQKCDRYIAALLEHPPRTSLSDLLSSARSTKARLLHYCPPSACGADSVQTSADDWCGWHTDHGALTGLTAAMYISPEGVVPNPDRSAGLYIKTRHGAIVQVAISEDCIAFQVGEVLQVLSGGTMMATPHCVRAASGQASLGISRNTLAVFLQPDLDYVMELPEGATPPGDAVSRWEPGIAFGEFCKSTLKTYYSL